MKYIKVKLLLLFIGLQIVTLFGQQNEERILSLDEAKTKGEEFINKIILKDVGLTGKIKSISEEGCFYRIIVETNGQDYTSYLTKDGKKFFQSGRDMDMELKRYEEERRIIKSDKPKVELFVMSYCPYGMQMEKGLLPVLELLGNKIDFELKFCSYIMHEEKELTEQLREYCIQKEYPHLLNNYLTCFLTEGNARECLAKVSIDTVRLNDSMAEADRQFKVTEAYNDKANWYMEKYPYFTIYKEENSKYFLTGSPTLVINGKKVAAARDPQSLLTTICSAFNSPTEECKTKLSSVKPAPGFGFNTKAPEGPNSECNVGNTK